MKIVKLFVAALSLSAAACGVEPEQTAELNVTEVDMTAPATGIENGHISGDIGDIDGVDTPASRLGVWDDGSYLAVETVGQLTDRAVMLFVSASNAKDLFVAGTDQTFTFGDYDHDGAQVGLLGCVGREVDVYDEYDAPADEVTVVVDPAVNAGPADVDVIVSGTWYIERDGQPTEVRTASTTFTLVR